MKRITWAIVLLALAAISISQFIPRTSEPGGQAPSSAASSGSRQVTIEITSDPIGAFVVIDGRQRGTTPLTLELAADRNYEYRVAPAEPYLDYKLYKPFVGTFTADENKAISVWVERTTAEEQHQQRAQAEADRNRRALEECQRQKARVELIIENWGWSRSSSRYVTAEGRVTNNTNRTIEYARVLVEYTTSSGQFITSDWTYLELTALLPGQSSPFSVITNQNPAMSKASIRFLDRRQQVIPAMNRSSLEC
ncbi:MAG: FxLYD domain-containing protein [Trueperaceae bacterium]